MLSPSGGSRQENERDLPRRRTEACPQTPDLCATCGPLTRLYTSARKRRPATNDTAFKKQGRPAKNSLAVGVSVEAPRAARDFHPVLRLSPFASTHSADAHTPPPQKDDPAVDSPSASGHSITRSARVANRFEMLLSRSSFAEYWAGLSAASSSRKSNCPAGDAEFQSLAFRERREYFLGI